MRPIFAFLACFALLDSVFPNIYKNDSTWVRPRVKAVRLTEPVKIDGILSESSWHTTGVDNFTQRDPHEGKPASLKTEVWVAYDDEALYIAARMYDNHPDSIVARLTRRDQLSSTDFFAVGVDAYHDRRTGFFFGITPAGAIMDGTFQNDDWTDDSWDGVWKGAASIDSLGWCTEIRIPYSQLRFTEKDSYIWGINFLRTIQRDNEESYFVMVPKNESGFVSRFADLIGIENIHPPRRIEILPYTVTGGKFLEHDKGDPFNNGSIFHKNAGADFRIGIGSNLTLSATVNPDFGQVEVDPAVVNLSDVETFYQEKRPIFIEGSSIFQFGFGGANNFWGFNFYNPDFFYSRRIGRTPQGSVPGGIGTNYSDIPKGTTILGAAKLTGKIADGWSLGTAVGVTQREYARVDTSGVRFNHEVEPLSYYGIARIKKEFNEGRQSIGFIGTTVQRDVRTVDIREIVNDHAYTFGMDGWTFLDKDRVWVITGWFGGSYVAGSKERLISLQRSSARYYQRPDENYVHIDTNATSLSGYMGRMFLNKQKGNFELNASTGLITPGFESNDIGYSARADIINGHIVMGYHSYDVGKYFRRRAIRIATSRNYNFGGFKTDEQYFMFYNTQLVNYWGLNGNFWYKPKTFADRQTRGGPMMISLPNRGGNFFFYSDDRKQLSTESGVYSNRSESNSYNYGIYSSLIWKPNSQVKLTLSPEFDRSNINAQWVPDNRFPDPTAAATYGVRYLFAQLDQKSFSTSFRIDWTFTPKLSVQIYQQVLLTSGKYTGFKELARPNSYVFNKYGSGNSTINYNGANDIYTIDPNVNVSGDEFFIGNPNFNDKFLRGSAVLRWEYMPGSTIYFVWTNDQSESITNLGEFRLGRDFSNLLNTRINNIFLIKVSYWWNP